MGAGGDWRIQPLNPSERGPDLGCRLHLASKDDHHMWLAFVVKRARCCNLPSVLGHVLNQLLDGIVREWIRG